jgi:hypothetical protein
MRFLISIFIITLMVVNVAFCNVSKMVFAFYYPWYSSIFGGGPQTPALEDYISHDSRIIRQHLKWAEHSVLFIADGTSEDVISCFDGLHSYNPVALFLRGVKKGDIDLIDLNKACNFYREFINLAHRYKKIAAVTVFPGYDDTFAGGRAHPIKIDSKGGKLYITLWQHALQADPDWILITSFNEWYEGSQIEPSLEYGDLYLKLTAKYAAEFKKKDKRDAWFLK